MDPWSTASEIAAAVQRGACTAREAIESTLERIARVNPKLNAFTALTAERARARAASLDDMPDRAGLPLAGVPFAVKNLFDVAGLATLAGSKINRTRTPAAADAPLIGRLEAAGAILVGALNMGEYAYDFTGENIHYGPSCNPHDPRRMSGGSSGGSASAVGGGLVPLALGSDTNGSIRVPASLCGTFGLKPTYGRLPRTDTFPFAPSLDHMGQFTRSVADLAISFDAMQGPDAGDPVCSQRPIETVASKLALGVTGLKVAVGGGYFVKGISAEASEALLRVATVIGAHERIEIPEAERARSAAYVITAAEAATLHLDRLREQPSDFDPAVRDRLIAGAMIPAHLVQKAQIFRRWYRDRVLEMFGKVDAIIAPATPCTAPIIGQKTFTLDGVEMPVRPNLGVYTQPISFAGLPTVVVPVPLRPLPIGVQVIAAPWREDIALRIAAFLEESGIAICLRPDLESSP